MQRSHSLHSQCTAFKMAKEQASMMFLHLSSAKHRAVTLALACMVSPACGCTFMLMSFLIVCRVDWLWWAAWKVGHLLRHNQLTIPLTYWEHLQPLNLSLKAHFYVVDWFSGLVRMVFTSIWRGMNLHVFLIFKASLSELCFSNGIRVLTWHGGILSY